ncbi:glycosyltransferase family 2 protein [Candidatus Uhrbacteria bacterium]|nr:glycosyltransferase family 2 protein [Candidatus Uhrbacteria bacterium]
MNKPRVSVIIRAKNEEAWIGKTLSALKKQTYQPNEVIVVDNNSDDKTVEIATSFSCTIIPYPLDTYYPGCAINTGIRASTGELLVILSAHAVPADDVWLERLVNAIMDNERLAGVYGRQLPLPDSSPFDKRDLIITFGPEQRIQYKDSFFHNANSIIQRSRWEAHPFDETASNIEDRLWAKVQQEDGYAIAYEPEARVYHHHGIHQHGNTQRCETTVKILEQLDESTLSSQTPKHVSEDQKAIDILTILPISDTDAQHLLQTPNGSPIPFLSYVFDEIQHTEGIENIIVASRNEVVLKEARVRGFWTFSYVTPDFDGPSASLEDVLKTTLETAQKEYGINPSHVLYLKATHVMRRAELLTKLIQKIHSEPVDSVFVAKREYRACWSIENNRFIQQDHGFIKRAKKDPLWIGYTGIGCITKSTFILEGRRLGNSIAVLPVDHDFALLDIQDEMDLEIVKYLFLTTKHYDYTNDCCYYPCSWRIKRVNKKEHSTNQ